MKCLFRQTTLLLSLMLLLTGFAWAQQIVDGLPAQLISYPDSYHLTRQLDLNTTAPTFLPDGTVFYPANTPRINPALVSTRYISADAVAHYNSFQFNFTHRLTHGFQAKLSYTFSKNIDDASNVITLHANGNSTSTMNPFNIAAERGLSAFDIENNLVLHFTYDLPWNNFSGVAGKLAGGWQFSSILTFSDGMPFTALTGFNRSRDAANSVSDRPNLVPGASTNPVLGGPDHYFAISGFSLPAPGFYGNVGRNTLIEPGFNSVDLNFIKETKVGERLKVTFRAGFFNLLNRANFGLPLDAIFGSNGLPVGSYGRINATVSTSRQIQFGAKFLF